MQLSPRLAAIYAAFAFISAAVAQAIQVGIAFTANQAQVLDSPTRWAISAAVGVAMAGLVAALPWFQAVLPKPPAPPTG